MQHCRMLFYLLYIRLVDDIDSDTRVALHPADGGYCHDKGTMLLEFTRNVEKRRRKSRSTIEEEYTEKKRKKKKYASLYVRAQRNASHQLKRTRFEVLENNGRNGA